ncbi:MAG: transpeptidase family protein [Clostridia bacterium]|nr:transpeptidase family protein [Clostridia bacterium]
MKSGNFNEKSSKIWVILSGIALTLFALFLVNQLYVITIIEHEAHAKASAETQWKFLTYPAERGIIYDANGYALASNTYDYIIQCTPKNFYSSAKEDKLVSQDQIIDEFVAVLGIPRDKMETCIMVDPKDTNDPLFDVGGFDLCRNVSAENKEILSSWLSEHSVGGISFRACPQRYYNYGEFASQVIGYAQNQGSLNGVYGLEAYYNSVLSGTDGYRYAEVDAKTEGVLPYSAPTIIDPVNGNNLVLNIDVNIQKIAEDACKSAYDKYAPKEGVCCIVMNPNTGAVLAMVSMPDYDLNDPYGAPYGMDESVWKAMDEESRNNYLYSSVWRNRCISDTYEPGSTFKALTTAIALEENLTYEDEMFSDAPIKVSDIDTISCWMQKSLNYNHDYENLVEAFQNSCNPIFVQLSYRIGVTKYYEYVHMFGFYERTGIDLPAEGVGIFHTQPTNIDMACLSFGESATVTPIQLLNSYCAMINGGDLMVPHVVKYITDSDGNIVDEIEPEVIRTVFSEDTCARVRNMMEKVVKDGTGSAGQVAGYSVAGKTSTSTIETGEEKGMHVLSFSCYAPSYNPQIAVLVVLNKPADRSVGSSAAASTAARVVEGTLTYMGVPRLFTVDEYDKMTIKYYVQQVSGMSAANASSKIGANGISTIYGTPEMTADTPVSFTYPGIDATLYSTGVVIMYPEGTTDEDMLRTTVPNLTGKNAVECMQALKDMNLNCNIEGDVTGVCVEQSVDFGESVLAGEIITVKLSNDVVIAPTPTPDPVDVIGNEDGFSGVVENDEETPTEG